MSKTGAERQAAYRQRYPNRVRRNDREAQAQRRARRKLRNGIAALVVAAAHNETEEEIE